MRKAVLILLTIHVVCFSQSSSQSASFAPFQFFVGSWVGTGSGQAGDAQLEREYQFVLNGKYLRSSHKSTYRPQQKNPKGEGHEELGLLSYDRAGKQFVLRQFHAEGFVIQYRMEPITNGRNEIVFISESIENIASGWRAKETYKKQNANEFTEVFELAAPGKEFEVYSENTFKRKL